MVLAVIPARLASSRFPRKVLQPVRGKPLLYHVWHSVVRAKRIDRVIIASSDTEILDAARRFGAETFRTSAGHRTGSDRAAEVARRIPAPIIVNVQADSLDLPAAALDRLVAKLLTNKKFAAGTLIYNMSAKDAANTDRVKVVVADDGRALWFSRQPIPHPQAGSRSSFTGHVGVYAYRRASLLKYGRCRQTRTEKIESLEQLRFLECVGEMQTVRLTRPVRSIDRPTDLRQLA